jgi:hypothetical protein
MGYNGRSYEKNGIIAFNQQPKCHYCGLFLTDGADCKCYKVKPYKQKRIYEDSIGLKHYLVTAR